MQSSSLPELSGSLQPLGPNDAFVAVMGMTGAGKSTFISRCLGRPLPHTGHGLGSDTLHVTIHSTLVEGRRLHLIDTPGFDDSRRPDAVTLQEIAFWLSSASRQGLRLAGIILLQSINMSRMQGSSLKGLQIFKALCGRQNFLMCLLVTTHWDLIDRVIDPVVREQAESRQLELVRDPELWGDMVQLGADVATISMHDQTPLSLVKELLSQGHSATLHLQDQLASPESTLCDTDAGALVFENTNIVMASIRQDMANALKEMKQAQRQRDNQNVLRFRELANSLTTICEAHRAHVSSMERQYNLLYGEVMQELASKRSKFLELLESRQKDDQAFHAEMQRIILENASRASPPPSYHAVEEKSFSPRREVEYSHAPTRSVTYYQPVMYSQSSSDGRTEAVRRRGSSRAERVGAIAGVTSAVIGFATVAGCVMM